MKSQPAWSRREFIAAMSVAGVGTALTMHPLTTWATIGEIDPRVAAIVAKTIGVDTHNHIDLPLVASELPGPHIELAAEMKRSGLSAICMTFALDYEKTQNPGEPYDRFKNWLTAMDQQLKDNSMKRALNMADLRKAHDDKQPTAIQSVEGGHFLEGYLERMEEAYGRGLRHMGVLHDSDASVPLGDVYTNTPKWGGLTEFGANVIKECNRLGILIDLAHANLDTVKAALKISSKPVIISHTGLDTRLGSNADFARMMKPRLISKEQAKIVADAGSIIGVWTHLADSPQEYAQNIRALVDVIGVDHVCIGTDTKLTKPYHKPGSPEGPRGDRPGERTNLAWQDQKDGFYYTVVDAMLKTGFSEDEIGKIGGGNFCRVFDAATAGHS